MVRKWYLNKAVFKNCLLSITHQPEPAGVHLEQVLLTMCQRSQNVPNRRGPEQTRQESSLVMILSDPRGWSNAGGSTALKTKQRGPTPGPLWSQTEIINCYRGGHSLPMALRGWQPWRAPTAVSLLSKQCQVQPFQQRPKGRTVHFKWLSHIVCKLYLN